MTLVAYQVDCADLVDLTQPKTLAALDITKADLACAWEDLSTQGLEPPTWKLTDQLHDTGIVGVIVQSFAPGCKEENRNLVLWRGSDEPPHCISVIDDFGRLPKFGESRQTQKEAD